MLLGSADYYLLLELYTEIVVDACIINVVAAILVVVVVVSATLALNPFACNGELSISQPTIMY